MSVKSVVNGWTCEGCGVNRNEVTQVWQDCQCNSVTCLNCSHTFNVTPEITYHDRLGKFTVCPECEGSFDID
jgi:hypothetical protein